MHFVNHNFTDIDFETKHMSRIEKTIYFDLRSLYLSEEKPIDGSDMNLLQRRLSVTDEEEKQALVFVLKDKFNKAGKYYKRAAWDKVLKNYKHANRNKGNASGNEFGNASGNAGNNESNALSNSERVAKSKKERKCIIDNLTSAGIAFDKKSPIATLRNLHEKHVVIEGNETGNETNEKNAAITSNHKPITNNHKPVRESDTHTNTGEMIVDNFDVTSVDNSTDDSQPSEVQPVPAELPQQPQPSVTQPATKAEQIRSQRSDDIENWEAPSIDTMRGELFRAGKMMQLTDDQYALHVEDFKAHYSQQALIGRPLATESIRKSKLRKWLASEIDNQQVIAARQDKAKGTFNIDNEDWSGKAASRPTHSDNDLPPVYHPSHSQPAQEKRDPSKSVIVNGLMKAPFPDMDIMQSYAYIKSRKSPGESADETYDRLLTELQEAV